MLYCVLGKGCALSMKSYLEKETKDMKEKPINDMLERCASLAKARLQNGGKRGTSLKMKRALQTLSDDVSNKRKGMQKLCAAVVIDDINIWLYALHTDGTICINLECHMRIHV